MRYKTNPKTDCTFTSLCGKRVRCNQTGAVMSRKVAKAFRRSYLAPLLEEYNIANNHMRKDNVCISPPRQTGHIPVRRVVMGTNGHVSCPYCHYLNWSAQPQAIVCRNIECERTFVAEGKPKIAEIQFGQVKGSYCHFVYCPNCSHINEVRHSGIEKDCESCGRRFVPQYS